jgi:hypothetical protein
MASPHAVVDDVSQTVLLHFHCGVCVAGETYTCGMAGEVTFGASSSNGATFDALPKVLWKQQLKSVRIGSWVRRAHGATAMNWKQLEPTAL